MPQETDNRDSENRRFLISGRVQGVWFRDSTRRRALSMNLSGFARNLPDGRVEVIATGAASALDGLRTWLQQGPPLAKVESVREDVLSPDDAQMMAVRGFEVL